MPEGGINNSNQALYYVREDAGDLFDLLGFSDPNRDGILTDSEVHQKGNESFAIDYELFRKTYTVSHPLRALYLTQDPHLIRHIARHLSAGSLGDDDLKPPQIPEAFPNPSISTHDQSMSRLFTVISVDVADIQGRLSKDNPVALRWLEGSEPVPDHFTAFKILSLFYQNHLQQNPHQDSFIIRRSVWDQTVASTNQSSGKNPVSANHSWDELMAIWGAQIENGPCFLNALIPNQYGQIDLAPSSVKIDGTGIKCYLKDPQFFQKISVSSAKNPYPYEVTTVQAQASVRFPSLTIPLAEAWGGGLYMDVTEGAKATAHGFLEGGEFHWDSTWPLVRLEGFALRMKPALLSSLPIIGVTTFQHKIVVVAHRSSGTGVLDPFGQDYVFYDITPFVYKSLCQMDPPVDCSDYTRIKDVVFTTQGYLRDNIPLHELQTAILMAFQVPAWRKQKTEGGFDKMARQVPLSQLHEELVVQNFSAHYGPKNFGSLSLEEASITKANLVGAGTLPDNFIVKGEIPINLKGSMPVDGGLLPVDVDIKASLIFDTHSGMGSVEMSAEKFPIPFPGEKAETYGGSIAALFSLPNTTKVPLDYSSIMKSALFSLSAHIEKNEKDWLLFKSTGQFKSQVDSSKNIYQLLGSYNFNLGDLKGLKGIVADGRYFGLVINDLNQTDHYAGIGVTSEAKIDVGLATLLGHDVVAAVYRENDGSYHIRPRAKVTGHGKGGDGTLLGDSGEIILRPSFKEGYARLEVHELGMDVDHTALRTDSGDFFGKTKAKLDGVWVVQGDSLADIFEAQNWIGSGTLSLNTAKSHLEFKSLKEGEETADSLTAQMASGQTVLLNIGALSFSNPRYVKGSVKTDQKKTKVDLDWGGLHLDGQAANVRSSVSGTFIPRLVVEVVEPAEMPAGVIPLESEAIEGEDSSLVTREAEARKLSPVQQSQIYHKPFHDVKQKIRPPEIPESEGIKEPLTTADKVRMFFQQFVDFSPSIREFQVTAKDILIGADAKYVDGKAKIPLLGKSPNGLKITVEEGTRVDEEASIFSAKDGKLKELVVKLNKPFCILGIKVSGLHLETRKCPFTGKEKHLLLVDTCLGEMNLLCLLSLFGGQFKPCEFYKMLKDKYGIDLPLNSIPRELPYLSLFLYELFNLYGDKLDVMNRPDSQMPSLISFIDSTGFFATYGMRIEPGEWKIADTTIKADDRARKTIHGHAFWRPKRESFEATLAERTGEVLEGVSIDAEGLKSFTGKFETVSNLRFYMGGDLKEATPFEISFERGHIDNMNVSYTPTGETKPLFHLISGNDPITGEHSEIQGSLRVARVVEENGNLHYEVQTILDNSQIPYGHVDFSREGRTGSYDLGGSHLKRLEVEVISKSFLPDQMNDPTTAGFKRIFIDGELEQPINPHVNDENPALVLSLGKDRYLVFQKLSTRKGHVHFEMEDGKGPIQYSGIVDLLMNLPEDPRFKAMAEKGWILDFDAISVSGPAMAELKGAEGGIRYMEFEGENFDFITVTVTGRIHIPYNGGFIELNSVTLPLKELLVQQIPDPKNPGDEIPSLKKLLLAPLELEAQVSGVFTTPDIKDVGKRRIEIPAGSRLKLKTGGETELSFGNPGEIKTLEGSLIEPQLILLGPADSKGKKPVMANLNADTLEIENGSLNIKNGEIAAHLREAIYKTLIQLVSDGIDVSVAVDEEVLKTLTPPSP